MVVDEPHHFLAVNHHITKIGITLVFETTVIQFHQFTMIVLGKMIVSELY